MTTSNRRHIKRLGMWTCGLLVLSVLVPGTAWAATCSTNGNTITITGAAGTTTLKMNGANLSVSTCPDQVLTTIAKVNITGTANDDILVFDLSGGAFNNTGGNSLTFEVDLLADTTDDKLTINGSDSEDAASLGDKGVNLDYAGSEDVEGPNKSAAFTSMNIELVEVNGKGGNDALYADGSKAGDPLTVAVTLNGDDGDDIIDGGSGNDTLNGGAGKDRLDGGLGDDTETGGVGKDTFDQDDAINGNDVLDGVDGRDRVNYGQRTAAVDVTLNNVADDGETVELDNVKRVEQIDGGDGGDTIDASGEPSLRHFLNGGEGDDTLTGGDVKDFLLGDEGNDTLNGGDGNDVLDGDEGNDTETGGIGNDTFDQGREANGGDDLNGGDGRDVVNYVSRRQNLNVTLSPTLAGADDDGETGELDDVAAIETVRAGQGADTIDATSMGTTKVFLKGGRGVDTMTGDGGDDKLTGDDGNDILAGGSGNDKLYGSEGDDTLNGGAGGSDLASGGADTDTCTNAERKRSCEI